MGSKRSFNNHPVLFLFKSKIEEVERVSTKNFIILVLLSIIWSTTFIFLKYLAPFFGSSGTACLRLLSASIFLLVVYKALKYKINWKRDWKFLCIIGIINASIPFCCFAFAALYIPTSLSAILNSLTPFFGVVFAAILFKEKITLSKLIGLSCGVLGVYLISSNKIIINNSKALLGVIAVIMATACYGLAANLIKKYGEEVDSKSLSCGSQFFAGIALLPFFIKTGVKMDITFKAALIMLCFGVLCSAIAYLIFFYLVKEIGPISSLTVTFLIPIFSLLWGTLLLHEIIYPLMILGILLIFAGTLVITKPNFRKSSLQIASQEEI
jgi:drug/metabolite transporter (DMT)-like permease